MALRTASCTHLLTFHPELIPPEAVEGEVEGSFEITGEVSGNTRNGLWYKEAYLTVLNNKLTIHIGDHVASRLLIQPRTIRSPTCRLPTPCFAISRRSTPSSSWTRP